jgi:hypothetical protein
MKKVFSGYISPICGAAHSQPIPTVFDTLRNPVDLINRAKFHIDRLRGFGLAGS